MKELKSKDQRELGQNSKSAYQTVKISDRIRGEDSFWKRRERSLQIG